MIGFIACPQDAELPSPIRSVAFVCTGNICRSPMAEYLLRRALPDGIPLEVRSYGTLARPGNPPAEGTLRAAAAFGIDIRAHRATPFSGAVRADLVFTMERHHMEDVLLAAPDLTDRVFALGCFSPVGPSPEREIADPYGGPLSGYLDCFREIEDCIAGLAAFLVPRVEGAGGGD